jgi:protease-4
VIVSMGDLAASGGYSLAAAAGTSIVAYPETLTGSIGVFYGKLVLAGLYEKLGLEKQILSRGQFAAIDSEARPLSAAEREKLRSLIEEMYRDFVTQVARSRKRTYEEIHNVAQGRVWLGDQAKSAGLVDALGGFDAALALAREQAGIADHEQLRIEVFPQGPGWLESVRTQINALASFQVNARAGVRKRLPYFSPDL